MSKYDDIRKRLVFTDHGVDNITGNRYDGDDRTDVPVGTVARVICSGILGFAGNNRFKKTWRGITVIYKVDNRGNIVVITYYKSKRNKGKSLTR